MGDDPSKIGLQHPAFAVSKLTLLNWLNDFFELSYAKVEECATGAIYCQIMDCLYPGTIPMSRVNWAAKSEYEFVNNFKLVQKVFTNKQISKPIHIDKLVKAKYQDNLEFLQWFKHFFECRYSGAEYKAKERRGAKGPKGGKRVAGKKPVTRPTSARTTSSKTTEKKTNGGASSAKVTELNETIAQLQETVEGLEKERDFYFGKLREVEVLAQDENQTFTKEDVLAILYKTDEDAAAEGGEAAEEDGEEETF